jgi:hydroxyethylthiazole kinase-like uncharacterized protein yjeF
MRSVEINAEYFGISLLQLMENAGHAVAEEIKSRFDNKQRVVIFSGIGGNGGDGFVIARHLLAMGFCRLAVVLVGRGKDSTHEAAKVNYNILSNLGDSIPVVETMEIDDLQNIEIDVAVDALLGTGTKGKLRSPIINFVKLINSLNAARVSVDVPTGIDSDSGDVLGDAVKADLTVTFYKPKKGLELASEYTGEVVTCQIGLPSDMETFVGPGDVMLVLTNRKSSAHKGDFGRVLFVGGSEVFSGAPALMSMAALRTGVDIAYTAAPEAVAHDISSMSPNLITLKLDGKHLNPENLDVLREYIAAVDAVVLGPGAGLHSETKVFVRECIKVVEEFSKPLLLDADGLKAFAEVKRKLSVPLILTPHAGEFFILTGEKLPDDLSSRVNKVLRAAGDLNATILLKGPVDIISNGEKIKLNFSGNPGMTVGGTGDVLTGVVGAFLAQGINAFEAAVAGAFVNGAAGDLACSQFGYHLVATDLLDFLPQILNDPMSHVKVRRTVGKIA